MVVTLLKSINITFANVTIVSANIAIISITIICITLIHFYYHFTFLVILIIFLATFIITSH